MKWGRGRERGPLVLYYIILYDLVILYNICINYMSRPINILTAHLKSLNVVRPLSVAGLLLSTNCTNSNLLRKYIYAQNIQNGGGMGFRPILEDTPKTKKVEILYNELPYIFMMSHDEDTASYHLYQKHKENDKNVPECVYIQIYKKEHTTSITHITYDSKCIPNLESSNNGSTLLKVSLKLINTIKDRYKIKQIRLTDNSNKKCGTKELRLGLMMTLLTGTTWYGRYGFYPENKDSLVRFEKNTWSS